jgi:hypothetical protein
MVGRVICPGCAGSLEQPSKSRRNRQLRLNSRTRIILKPHNHMVLQYLTRPLLGHRQSIADSIQGVQGVDTSLERRGADAMCIVSVWLYKALFIAITRSGYRPIWSNRTS